MVDVIARDRFEYGGKEHQPGDTFSIEDAEDLRILLGFDKIEIKENAEPQKRGRYKRRDMRAEGDKT